MLEAFIDESVVRVAIALGIGLLIGAERERRMTERGRRGSAGIRTFTLAALLGALVDQVGGEPLLAVALAFVAIAALAGYFREPGDLGITTEVALVVTFLLGVLAQREAALASGLAVTVTVLLATRGALHRFVGSVLTEQELHDALLLAACVLVVLPLLPNRGFGPFEVLNPFAVWRLVVLLLAISSAGYIAVRALGATGVLALAGLLGGFVSSTATISAMGRRAAREPAAFGPAATGALLSTVATVAQLAAVLAAVSPPTLRELAVPLLLAGLAALGSAGVALVRLRRSQGDSAGLDYGRAFELRDAVVLGGLMSLVTLASAAGSEYAGAAGVQVAASLGGFADVHAAAIGASAVAAAGQIEPSAARLAVLGALTTNTLSKLVFARISGGPRFAAFVGAGLLSVPLAAWIGALAGI